MTLCSIGLRSVQLAVHGTRKSDGKAVDAFLWDDDLHGFGLKVTPSGNKVYIVQYRLSGRPPTKRYTIGKHGSPWTPATARDKAKAVLRKAEDGIDPASADRVAAADTAFEVVFADFMKKHHEVQQTRTRAAILAMIDHHVTPHWRGRAVGTITRADVILRLDKVAQTAPVQANRVYQALSTFFNWCVGRGVIENTPMTKLPKPGKETERDRVLSHAELKAIWGACDEIGWPFGPVIRLLMLTGQRESEVGDLEWSELRPDGIWELPPSRSKNRLAHLVPMTATSASIIAGLPRIDYKAPTGETRKSPFVFTTTGETPVSGWSSTKERIDLLVSTIAGPTEPVWAPPLTGKKRGFRLRYRAFSALERWAATEEAVTSGLVLEAFRSWKAWSKEAGEPEDGVRAFTERLTAVGFTIAAPVPWIFHDLRRTVSTEFGRLKVPPHVNDRVLNHVEPGVRKVYDRWQYLNEKRDALDSWDRALSSIVAEMSANLVEQSSVMRKLP